MKMVQYCIKTGNEFLKNLNLGPPILFFWPIFHFRFQFLINWWNDINMHLDMAESIFMIHKL